VTAEEYKLLSSFEEIRKKLLTESNPDRLERPLAYWALPNDRRLPLAFLGRTLRDLLHTPFDELSATPGIGQKKIASLVRLLQRASEDVSLSQNGAALAELGETGGPSNGGESDFDPATLSEGVWDVWRQTVRRHRLGHEKLGRLAGSLQNLPTVIWRTPLRAYLGYSLAEIRRLKTHGEKRVRAVLEVFYDVHKAVGSAPLSDRLCVSLRPAFIGPIEEWLDEVLADPAGANPASADLDLAATLQERLAIPLLNQIERDSGPTVRGLVEGRLGILGVPQTVRHQSRKMGVTRARVYQLLDDCAKVAEVRWPEGKALLAALASHLDQQQADSRSIALVGALREILYPEKLEGLEESDDAD
jgi:hypothetical protein